MKKQQHKTAILWLVLLIGIGIETHAQTRTPDFDTNRTNPFGLSDVGSTSVPTFVDIDTDGDLDCFVGERPGNINFFENTGTNINPVFSLISTSNPFGLSSVATDSYPVFVDIDADGDYDCFIGEDPASGLGILYFYENTGTASSPVFTRSTDTTPFGIPRSSSGVRIDFVDMDGDGDLDAFQAASLTQLRYLENTGSVLSPAFTVGATNPFGLTATSSTVIDAKFVDIDEDGDYDCFMGEFDGRITFFENTGTAISPSFVRVAFNPFGLTDVGARTSPTFTDINGDGNLDCFIGERDGVVNYFKNEGTQLGISFSAPVSNPFSLTSVTGDSKPAFGDIDSDGDLDLFVGSSTGNVGYFKNTGTNINPTYASMAVNPFGLSDVGSDASYALADLDGDGDLDILVGESDGNVNYFQNTGTPLAPTFAAPVNNPFGITSVTSRSMIALADLDADGDLDLLIGSSTGNTGYYQNTGDANNPAFASISVNAFGLSDVGTNASPSFIDFDRDGDLDIMMGTGDGNIVYFYNTGTAVSPSFSSSPTNPFGLTDIGTNNAPTFVDINQDGVIDAFIGEEDGNTNYYAGVSTTCTSDFTTNPKVGCAVPHFVFFTDQSSSINITTGGGWFWDFGDGNISTVQNPVHNYTSTGEFIVTLTINDGNGCINTHKDTINVEIPTASFNTADAFGFFGCGPLTVNFVDESTGAVSWVWDFGDGGTSTDQNPTYTYQTPGVYTVALTMTTANGCTNTQTKTNYVQVIGPDVNLGAPAVDTSACTIPHSVNFKDSTIFGAPITSWTWDFGDGSGTSNLQNPTYNYTTAGHFDVSLSVTDIDGCSRTFTRTQYIQTNADCIWDGATWLPSTPLATSNIRLDGGYDINTNGNLLANDLTINIGQILAMGSGSIELTGNLVNNGNAFTQTGGTFTLNGTTNQVISGDNSFSNLVVNNTAGVTINDSTRITGLLYLQSGTFASGGNLVIASDASSTGMVVNSGGSVSGDVEVQRFLNTADNANAGYRAFGVPVSGKTVADFSATSGFTLEISRAIDYNNDYSSVTATNYPNFFFYDEARVANTNTTTQAFEKGWNVPTASTNALTAGKGFTTNITPGGTVSFTGTLNTGDIDVTASFGAETNSGWHLLGNPYASPLDWNEAWDNNANNQANFESTYYSFSASGAYTGTYSGFNASTDLGVNGGTKDIASMQGFFVRRQGMNVNPDFQFRNTQRLTTFSNPTFYKTKAIELEGVIRLELSPNSEPEKADEWVGMFADDATNKADALFDAHKIVLNGNGFPSIMSYGAEDGSYLMMDARKTLGEELTTIPLQIHASKTDDYTLKLTELRDFPLGTEIILEDKLTGSLTELKTDESITFSLDNNDFVADRFFIHFKISKVTSLQDDLRDRGVSVWANSGLLYINFADAQSAAAEIEVFDLQGRLILAQSNKNELNPTLEMPQSGIFIVRVSNARGIFSEKVSVEN